MTRSIALLLVCMILSFHVLFGQDTTFLSKQLNLNEITISASRKSQSSPIFQVKRIDSVSLSDRTLNLDLATLLHQSLPINLTSYGGKGSLTSIRLRGTGSNHTQINWNGIPVNSITAGSADIAQFLPGLFDRIEIVSGASGSMFGSGTFGGAINLENQPTWSKQIKTLLYSEVGSWQHWLNGFTTRVGNDRFRYHLSTVIQNSDNTYPYNNTFKPGNPLEIRVNDTLRTFAFQQNMFWKMPSSFYLQAGSWFQTGQKDVPNSMSVSSNRLGSQEDLIFRGYVRVKKYFRTAYVEGQSSWSSDRLSYREKTIEGDTELVNHSILTTNRLISTGLYRQYIRTDFLTEFGYESDLQKALSASYASPIKELRGSLFSRIEYKGKSMEASGSLRFEFTPHMGIKPLYSLGLSKNILPFMEVRILISSKFRAPTLNERYWNPGGNLELKPEFGHGYEAGLTITENIGSVLMKGEGNVFLQNIHDWIQWIPNGPYWSPKNIRFVSCRGGDLTVHATLPFKLFNILLISSISYTESLDMNRPEIQYRKDRQLAYVPLWMGTSKISFSNKRWTAGIDYRYTGLRFTTDDHDPWLVLSPAHIIDLNTSCLVINQRIKVVAKLRLENLLNINYQWVMGYPSPGRGFYITLICKY